MNTKTNIILVLLSLYFIGQFLVTYFVTAQAEPPAWTPVNALADRQVVYMNRCEYWFVKVPVVGASGQWTYSVIHAPTCQNPDHLHRHNAPAPDPNEIKDHNGR